MYNIEHTIHHLALIKVGLKLIYPTLNYRIISGLHHQPSNTSKLNSRMSKSSSSKRWTRWRQSSWWIRWSNWEYWPMQVVNIPVGFIWLYYAIRARHPFFFSNTNPVIENGGFMGESKHNIYQHLPENYLPKTALIRAQDITTEAILSHAGELGITYPFILKPNIGERGFRVERIDDYHTLEHYLLDRPHVDLLIQEYVTHPVELSVMYHRLPHTPEGKSHIGVYQRDAGGNRRRQTYPAGIDPGLSASQITMGGDGRTMERRNGKCPASRSE